MDASHMNSLTTQEPQNSQSKSKILSKPGLPRIASNFEDSRFKSTREETFTKTAYPKLGGIRDPNSGMNTRDFMKSKVIQNAQFSKSATQSGFRLKRLTKPIKKPKVKKLALKEIFGMYEKSR